MEAAVQLSACEVNAQQPFILDSSKRGTARIVNM